MKTAQTIPGLLAGLAILVVPGCGDSRTSSSRPTQAVNANEQQALKELGTKVGIAFPTDAVLVNSGDGGGRDPSHVFYEWAIFSPSPIKMPPMRAVGVQEYLILPLEGTVNYVQNRMAKRKVDQPQAAFSSSWQTNGFGFGGTLIRSAKGDYLVIRRGRIN